ncbi:zinc metallopeptidase [candidate division KSB1 bacterium]|nr:zinc metallopeptidase [candidate division KSB1 bacterium]
MYFGFSGTDIFILGISFLITLYAQLKVKNTFNKYSQIAARRGASGASIAQHLLQASGIHDVEIEMTRGELTDHYDPRGKVLRLSEATYRSNSVAAIGVAAHEVGHAIQHHTGYIPLNLRNSFVPVANLGSWLAWPLVILAFVFQQHFLLELGIYLFAGVVIFQLITLPVEFNASRNALLQLEAGQLLNRDELTGARKVLTAAALTYVAAAAVAILNLIRLLLIARDE